MSDLKGVSGWQGIGKYYPDQDDPQKPANVAVVIPTILRPVIARAIKSVYRQKLEGRIQLMIGVDVAGPFQAGLDALLDERPSNISALVLSLPYSTSVRNGGVHLAADGGSLRPILSFMANARHVAYLDDDNSWRHDHLAKLLQAVHGKVWSFSQRVLVDEVTEKPLATDIWDSVGVNKGRFASQGGFVDPNCLLVDKVRAASILGRWAEDGTGKVSSMNDRNFFRALRSAPHGVVEEATVAYRLRRTNILHRFIREQRV